MIAVLKSFSAVAVGVAVQQVDERVSPVALRFVTRRKVRARQQNGIVETIAFVDQPPDRQ